jgi:hypothetical protein
LLAHPSGFARTLFAFACRATVLKKPILTKKLVCGSKLEPRRAGNKIEQEGTEETEEFQMKKIAFAIWRVNFTSRIFSVISVFSCSILPAINLVSNPCIRYSLRQTG